MKLILQTLGWWMSHQPPPPPPLPTSSPTTTTGMASPPAVETMDTHELETRAIVPVINTTNTTTNNDPRTDIRSILNDPRQLMLRKRKAVRPPEQAPCFKVKKNCL